VPLREVAEYDPDRIARVLKWRISDLLLRYLHLKRVEAMEMFRLQLLIHAFLAPYRKKDAMDDGPQLPLFVQTPEG
jgi:hypothetical protein